MKMFLRNTSLLLLVIAFSLLSRPGSAQTSYGALAGSITDQSGAAVSDANITARNTGTGETHVVKSKADGGYLIDAIGTGLYDALATTLPGVPCPSTTSPGESSKN